MRGKRAFVGSDLRELIDLYRWGARMSDLCMLYGVEKQTIRSTLKLHGVKLRPPHRSAMAVPKPHREAGLIKSTRPTTPAGARPVDGDQAPDQLLRSSARAQRDRRIAERPQGASSRSCPEAAS